MVIPESLLAVSEVAIHSDFRLILGRSCVTQYGEADVSRLVSWNPIVAESRSSIDNTGKLPIRPRISSHSCWHSSVVPYAPS